MSSAISAPTKKVEISDCHQMLAQTTYEKDTGLQRVPEVAGLALLLMLLAFGWAASEYQDQVQWVEHTLQVEKQIGRLWSALLDAETGQRGYLLTGSKPLLDPYNAAVKEVPDEIDKFRELTRDNAEQQKLIGELRPLIDDRMFLLRQRIEGYEKGNPDLANLPHGKAVMDQIRQKLDAMRALEAQLLDARKARSQWYKVAALFAAFGTALVSIVTLGAWIATARRSNKQLVALNRNLVQANTEREAGEAKLRQLLKMEAVGQLTGGVAHDFNNMLAVVLGGLRLAKKRLEKGDTNIQTFIDGAIEGAERAAALTKRLLAFSRQQPLEPKPVSPNKLISGMSDMICRTLGETIKVETVLAGGLWMIHVDPPQLENALLNLCVNARDAMSEGGNLTIETANAHLDETYAAAYREVTAGQYVMVAVSDSGVGMPRDIIDKAFDPFFTTKGAGKGTGLGLSQVHGFVKQSGGHIKIYSEQGAGTTVKMYFPRFIAAQDDSITSEGRAAQRPQMSDGHQLILVVEDDDQVRETTVAMLDDLGYATIQAECAQAALRQLDARPDVALMFTDIVMPDINGRKLAAEALKRRPELKVLFTTGFTKNAVVHNGVLDPGVQLLQKPFTAEELATKVRHALDGRMSE